VIIDQVPILPKLFRRLSDYMAATGSAVGFREALALGGDAVWDLRTQNLTHSTRLSISRRAPSPFA
jgi:hypothetical protein